MTYLELSLRLELVAERLNEELGNIIALEGGITGDERDSREVDALVRAEIGLSKVSEDIKNTGRIYRARFEVGGTHDDRAFGSAGSSIGAGNVGGSAG